MPLTRLDMISMAPKTQEAGTYKHNEMQHTANQQANITQTVQQQARHNEMQTVRTNHTENEEQKFDARNGGYGGYGGSSGQKKKEQEEKEEEQKKLMMGSTFNITV